MFFCFGQYVTRNNYGLSPTLSQGYSKYMTKELTFLQNHEMNDISFTYAYKEAGDFKDKSISIYIGIHKLMKYKEEGYEVMERLLYLASIPPPAR